MGQVTSTALETAAQAKTSSIDLSKILSRQTAELLIDLLDNKLTCLEVIDRDDARELTRMREAMAELERWLEHAPVASERGRRGRRARIGINALPS